MGYTLKYCLHSTGKNTTIASAVFYQNRLMATRLFSFYRESLCFRFCHENNLLRLSNISCKLIYRVGRIVGDSYAFDRTENEQKLKILRIYKKIRFLLFIVKMLVHAELMSGISAMYFNICNRCADGIFPIPNKMIRFLTLLIAFFS